MLKTRNKPASSSWNDDLLTGIETVDRQHEQLVNFAQQLQDELCKPHPSHEAVADLISDFVEAACEHFRAEEAIFQRTLYPDIHAHITEHNHFVRKLAAILERHEAGVWITLEAVEVLTRWLDQHIRKRDKAFVPFLG